MKSVLLFTSALALLAGLQGTTAFAASFCEIRPGANPAPYTFNLNIGSVYVPRHASIGSVIGQLDRPFVTTTADGRYVQCENHVGSVLAFNTVQVAPIFPNPLPPVGGEDVTGKVFQTGIAGVGVRIKLGHPFDGVAPDSFVPVAQGPTVPFSAILREPTQDPLRIITLLGNATLVKTGPIASGPQTVDTQVFSTRFSQIDPAFYFNVKATVIQAQCDVSVVSDNPVDLGERRSSDFTGPGYGTIPTPFSIALGNCESDPSDVTVAWATIRLDGVNGSVPIPDVEGGFTLTTDSDARGVAIQILRGDGITPVALGRDVPLMPTSPGNTVLRLSARYYQTGDAQTIVAGEAKGSLSFTISFM
jgi:type 1 fimbria pilin